MLIETDLRLTMNHVSNGLRLTSYLMNTSWSGGVHQSKEEVSQGPSLFCRTLRYPNYLLNHVSNGLRLTSYLMNTSWSGGVHQSKEEVSQGPSLFAEHLATQTIY